MTATRVLITSSINCTGILEYLPVDAYERGQVPDSIQGRPERFGSKSKGFEWDLLML